MKFYTLARLLTDNYKPVYKIHKTKLYNLHAGDTLLRLLETVCELNEGIDYHNLF